MNYRRAIFGVLIFTIFHLILLKASLFWQNSVWLFWPALLARIFLLFLASPALAVNGLLDLNVGFHLPLAPLLLVSHLTTLYLFTKARLLWTTLKSPAVPARRALLLGTGVVASGAAVGVSEARDFSVRSEVLALKDLPESLVGLKVLLMADLHRGPAVNEGFLKTVIEEANALKPDIVVMPGDFVSKSPRYFASLEVLLSALKPSIASFATLGNHDHWEGKDEALLTFKKAGVIELHNRAVFLGKDRKLGGLPGESLCLAGIDDLWTGEPDIEVALSQVSQNRPVLLLSHNPDSVEHFKGTKKRVDVQFSGHTHGGQIVLPALGPVATASAYGTKYIYGWSQGPKWRVFTTCGVGTSTIPVRLGTRPEIVLFTLERDEKLELQNTLS